MSQEQYIAHEGRVELMSWSESSSVSLTIKMAILEGRDGLDHFETVTKRSKKRSGQRYRVSLTSEDKTLHTFEAWFFGANWTHQGGAWIKLAIDPHSCDLIKSLPTKDVSDGAGCCFDCIMVQIGDDEKPVNQHLAEKEVRRKGGPRSKAAGMLMNDKDFQEYVTLRADIFDGKIDASKCDKWVKSHIGMQSKVDLDYDEDLYDRYMNEVHRPFIRWGQENYG